MFAKEIYIQRRAELKRRVGEGLILLFGNNDAPNNYPANTYRFRQDSCFLYYFGLKREGLVGLIDVDNDKEYIFGNDIDINDIIWYGYVPSVKELATEVGVQHTAPMKELKTSIDTARSQGKPIHYIPQCRYDLMIQLSDLIGIHPLQLNAQASVTLIKAIVDMRSIKEPEEVEELKKAADIGYQMHTTAMKLCAPGVTEKYIAGVIEGIAMSLGDRYSFQSILSMHGEIQHGFPSHTPMEAGRLMLCDAGAENKENYCSDNTRVTPISGTFTQQQRDIYTAVESAHDWVIANAKPNVKWLDMHMGACRILTEHLKAIGLMKGDTEEAVKAGAHALFMPHGLGHMMGLDVHDMEGLGQNHVGFDDEVQPSTQFGLNCLRCGRRLQAGFVMTDEPGIYFIPHLIDLWKSQGIHKDFINYEAIEPFRHFGGVRLEDDILITEDSCRIIGDKVIPYHINELEEFVKQSK